MFEMLSGYKNLFFINDTTFVDGQNIDNNVQKLPGHTQLNFPMPRYNETIFGLLSSKKTFNNLVLSNTNKLIKNIPIV